ncbi:hypothetical protein [Fibrobacter sp.]|uniref:hypothetical protein n=1 Tax=Fibrobacter sp. TaxID=35828 RepID=UPI003865444F
MHKRISYLALGLLTAASWAVETPEEQLERVDARMDSLAEYAASTVVGKDDRPVAISGDLTMRLKHFDYYESSDLQMSDQQRTIVQSALNVGIVVSPSSFLTVFSNLYLPFDFSGYFQNSNATQPNSGEFNHAERVPFGHWTDYYGIATNENMLAGIDVRAGGFGATFQAGGVIWANSSPLTMWERETMARFASQYETFEDEKVVSTYYKEKNFHPVKEGGRAFWTNRSFGGLFLDVHTLPYNMKAQFMLSQPMDADIATRDGTRMLGGQPGELEMVGTYDFDGMVYHGRVAKEKIEVAGADMTVGANYLGVTFENTAIYEPEYTFKDADGNPYIVDNHVASIDIKGNLTPKFYLMMDLALSWDDSTRFKPIESEEIYAKNEKEFYSSSNSTPAFGLYIKAQDKHWEPITLEAVYLTPDFYSPFGMTDPSRYRTWRQDKFYVGAGTFRYGPNMVGANIKVEPQIELGRFDVQYGIHRQLEKGDDMIDFKYNLNGRAMWESSNSWTKFKTLFTADSGNGSDKARNVARVGAKSTDKLNNREGGLRGGTWELWEGFVPYNSAEEAAAEDAPQHAKWNVSLVLDAGYEVGHFFGIQRNIMMSVYTALSGVSTTFSPLAYSPNQKDMLAWDWFVQSEPAVAITSTIHGLLILGLEKICAPNAYVIRTINASLPVSGSAYPAAYKKGAFIYEEAPIDITQTALGFGLDWDFTPRAGLHFRYKWMTSSDEFLPENDWKGHYFAVETKMWF